MSLKPIEPIFEAAGRNKPAAYNPPGSAGNHLKVTMLIEYADVEQHFSPGQLPARTADFA